MALHWFQQLVNAELEFERTHNENLGSTLEADIVIVCGSRRWKGSREVLTRGSAYFSSMLHHFQEGKTGHIELREDNPDALQALLKFLHTGHYSRHLDHITDWYQEQKSIAFYKDPGSLSLPKEWWTQHPKVFIAADKYGVVDLKEKAEGCMLNLLEKRSLPSVGGWEYLIQAIYDLEQGHPEKLRIVAIQRLDNFQQSIRDGVPGLAQTMEIVEPENSDLVHVLISSVEEMRKQTKEKQMQQKQKVEELEAAAQVLNNRVRALENGIQDIRDVVAWHGIRLWIFRGPLDMILARLPHF